MKHRYTSFIRFINILYDVLILTIAIFVTLSSVYSIPLGIKFCWLQRTSVIGVLLFWLIASFISKLYDERNLVYFKVGIKRAIQYFIVFSLMQFTAVSLSDGGLLFHKKASLAFLIVYCVLFFIARLIFYSLKKIYKLQLFRTQNVLLIGDGQMASTIKEIFVYKKELGYRAKRYVNDENASNDLPAFIENILKIVKEFDISEVFFVKSRISNSNLYLLIQILDKNTIRTRIVPDFFSFYTKPQNLSFIDNIPVLSIREEPLVSLFNRMLKRCADVLFSVMIIIAIFPWLFPLLSLLIKLESKGPVFFRQQRSGRLNTPFWCYKFRSMKKNNEANEKQASLNDNRVTKIGSFMRKTSLDELPQFFNVLIGNMSVVGPRPHMLKHTIEYSELTNKYMIRHFVKPGITGWAQVNGFRGEVTNTFDIQKRVEHDIWYIENWSLLLDVQIILLTVYNIFKGESKAY